MVQVSYPGVYVQEVASGVRTITGVSTSIAAFIGMARRGPVGAPRLVLGFTDYERIYSSDASLGEMSDQVRQFFQNGGQQAYIVREAKDATPSTVALSNGSGTVLTLTASSEGSDGSLLRATIDYNTANPESTFNLRVFREIVDQSGAATVQEDELYRELSMNSASARFVETVLAQTSTLVTGAVGSLTPTVGSSYSAKLTSSALTMVNSAISAAGGTGRFVVRVGDRSAVLVTLTGPLAALADIDTAIKTAYSAPANVTSTDDVGSGSLIALAIAAVTAGDDVIVTPANSGDISQSIGLGLAQGGVEIGAYGSSRPLPSGYVSVLGSDLGEILTVAGWNREDLTSIVVTGPDGFTVPSARIRFVPGSGIVAVGSVAGNSLINVRAALAAIAAGINAVQTRWRAEIHGTRLALLPRFGTSASGPGNSLNGTGTGWSGLNTSIFDPTETVAERAAEPLSGGTDGDPPELEQYLAAFATIDRDVDLFNLMILPRSFGDPERRQDVWGDASTFCEKRRAFLLVDASLAATSIEDVLDEVTDLRIGLVKDHAGLYWPRVTVPASGGLTKDLDPSGSVAGIMARIDGTRGVWKAPAGLEADVRGIRGVAINMSDAQNGLINPQAINAVRSFPNGIVSWGSRTMDGFDNSGNDDYKYVPVRRFALYIGESLYRGLKFAVFEPNDEQLWSQIRLAAGAFMNNLFRQGAFAGRTARDAYFVKVDSETTTQNDINLGIVNVLVGFAPLKPAEFVVVSIRQLAGQVQA